MVCNFAFQLLMKAYSQSIAFYGTIMTLSLLPVKSLLDHVIVYQRIHVILILPQGRRRISEILRRPSANDSSESFMLVATSITKDENSILTEVTYVWRIRLRCHCELAAGDRGNPRVRGIVGTD